jgi:hypothetical protein
LSPFDLTNKPSTYFLLLDLLLGADRGAVAEALGFVLPLELLLLPLALLLLALALLLLDEEDFFLDEDLIFFLLFFGNRERLLSEESNLDPLATEKARNVAMKKTPLKVRYALALNFSNFDSFLLVYPLA